MAVWRSTLLRGLSEGQDVVRVLMKPRNGLPWTADEKAFLMRELRRLASWTPALLLFLLPGSMLLLPLLAWALDRRRGVHGAAAGAGSPRREAADRRRDAVDEAGAGSGG